MGNRALSQSGQFLPGAREAPNERDYRPKAFKITSGVLVITASQPQPWRVKARLGLSTVQTLTWIHNSLAMRT